MRVLLTSLFLIAASLVASSALAQETCTPVAVTRAKAQAAQASFVQVTDAQAISAYSTLYNMQPPASDHKFTLVYLVILPGGNTVITLGNGDELCAQIVVPSDMIQRLMDRVMGRAI